MGSLRRDATEERECRVRRGKAESANPGHDEAAHEAVDVDHDAQILSPADEFLTKRSHVMTGLQSQLKE